MMIDNVKNVLKIKKSIFVMLCMISTFIFGLTVHAAVISRDADKVNAPNLENGLYVDDVNYGLQKLQSHMSELDYTYAFMYVSNYRRAIEGAEEGLRAIVAKYIVADDLDLVMDYILKYNNVEHLGKFKIDAATNGVVFSPIKNFTEAAGAGAIAAATSYWNNMNAYAPAEFVESIESFNIDNNRDKNELVTFYIKDSLSTKFEVTVDASICAADKLQSLIENIIYLTTYYLCFRIVEVDFSAPADSKNYKFQGFTYGDKSVVNLFYKRFWGGNKKEMHSTQYDVYNKEFINDKASYSVYDDMAVCFYNYILENQGYKYFWYKAAKISFFRDYGYFVSVAQEFRTKLGIGLG